MGEKYTLYLFLVISIIIGGCSPSPNISSEKPSSEQEPAKQETSETASEQNPDKSKFEEYIKARTKLVQQYRAYAENYYRLGKKQYDKFQLEMAGENLKIALRYNPNHRKANELLDKVQGLLGERPSRVRTFYDWAVQEHQVSIEQRIMEIKNLLTDGEKLYKDKKFAEAADRFRTALVLIRHMPYHVNTEKEAVRAREGIEKTGKK